MNSPASTALPPSLWSATASPAPHLERLLGEQRTQVVIIGGGYTGLSCALHLAEAGTDCVLLEANEIGWGASGRNGGQVIAGLKYNPDELEQMFGPDMGPRMVKTAGGTADLVFELIQRYAIDCEARREGWLQGAHSQSGLELQAERARQWRARGVQTFQLDKREAAKAIGSEWYEGAWLDPRGGTVQPLSYARGLAAAAVKLGARLFTHSPATRIERDAAGWVVHTPGGRVHARQVVIGNNAHQQQNLWPGLRETVVPAYSLQIATRPLPAPVRDTLLPGGQSVSETRRVLRYSRLDAAGRFIIGARAPRKDNVTLTDARDLHRDMLILFPQLAGMELEYVWTGCVAMTRDFLPHLHELAPNMFAGLGYNGRGVAMATMMGKLLAQRAGGASAQQVDFPTLPLQPIPLHGLTPVVAQLYARWYDLLDRLKV